MQLDGQRTIEAKPIEVWEALIDPNVLQKCIPGCKSMEGDPESGFEAVLVQKVGPVNAKFNCRIELAEIVPGKSCTITGQGKGGPAGFAKGVAKIALEDFEGGTRLAYSVEARVGGKIAQLGSRIIDGFAKKLANAFFQNFQESFEIQQPGQLEDHAGGNSDEDGDSAEGGKKKTWLKKMWG